MNPRRRRINRQRRLDRAAVLRVAVQCRVDQATALRALARGSARVVPFNKQACRSGRFVVGRWTP